MGQVLVDSNSLTAIAEAIRSKNKKIIKYKPAEMAEAITNIKNEYYVESNDAWGIIINQQEHEIVTATPVATVKPEGDRYRSKLSLELGVSAYTQYIPGQITQSLDTTNKIFVIDITPATPVAGMVTEDGWGKVYIKDSKFYDNENYSGSPLSDLSGNILVAGAQTNNFINNLASKNNLLKYKDNFTIKAATNFLYQCSKLTSVDLPNLTTTGNGSIYNCTSLTTINLPNLTTTGNSFLYQCSKLTSVNLPNLTTTGNNFMTYCRSLTTVDLSNITSIGNGSIYNCTSLTTINLPNLTTTGNDFMNYCNKLTSVNLPNLTTIGNNFMAYCRSLTTVDLSNITSIGTNSFSGCNALKYIVIDNNTVSKAKINPASGVKVLIPQSMMDAYSSDSYWSSYTSQLDAIENYTITRENGQITVREKIITYNGNMNVFLSTYTNTDKMFNITTGTKKDNVSIDQYGYFDNEAFALTLADDGDRSYECLVVNYKNNFYNLDPNCKYKITTLKIGDTSLSDADISDGRPDISSSTSIAATYIDANISKSWVKRVYNQCTGKRLKMSYVDYFSPKELDDFMQNGTPSDAKDAYLGEQIANTIFSCFGEEYDKPTTSDYVRFELDPATESFADFGVLSEEEQRKYFDDVDAFMAAYKANPTIFRTGNLVQGYYAKLEALQKKYANDEAALNILKQYNPATNEQQHGLSFGFATLGFTNTNPNLFELTYWIDPSDKYGFLASLPGGNAYVLWLFYARYVAAAYNVANNEFPGFLPIFEPDEPIISTIPVSITFTKVTQ